MDEDEVGPKGKYGEEKKDKDDDDLGLLDDDVDGTNDEEEEDTTMKTKEKIPKNLIFSKGVVDSDNLLPLNVNRETLQ